MTLPEDRRLSLPEFIVVIALNSALVAMAIDAMLPALPDIAEDLSPGDRNRAQLVITAFVFGMGVATLFTGPLSDSFGRKRITLIFLGIFLLGAWMSANATTMTELLVARALQGIGVAGPRVAVMAIIRDLYVGRQMAQVMSLTMLVFVLVPAVAPLLGAQILYLFDWRAIFYFFILFGIFTGGWFLLRQSETLTEQNRRPFELASLISGIRECFSHSVFLYAAIVQTLGFGMLFGTLSMAQQIFDETYARGDEFPAWFALISLLSGTASILNARLVLRFGMQRMMTLGMSIPCAVSALMLLTELGGDAPFWLLIFYITSVFFMAGLVLGNTVTLASEPLGHLAGMTGSILSSVATVGAVVIAVPVGYAFTGTPTPLVLATLFLSALAIFLIQKRL